MANRYLVYCRSNTLWVLGLLVFVLGTLVGWAGLSYLGNSESIGIAETFPPADLARISKRYKQVYNTLGMHGVSLDIPECYREAESAGKAGIPALRACMLYDKAAHDVDESVRAVFKSQEWEAGVPAIPYLEPDQFEARMHHYQELAFKGWSVSRIQRFVGDAPKEIGSAPLAEGGLASSERHPLHHEDLTWRGKPLPAGMRASKDYKAWVAEYGVDMPVSYAELSYLGEPSQMYLLESPSFGTSGYPHIILIQEGGDWRSLLTFRGGFIINESDRRVNDIVLYERNGADFSRSEWEYISGKHEFVLESKTDLPSNMPRSFHCYFWRLQGRGLDASECR